MQSVARIFWTNFRKILNYQILVKTRPVVAETFRADGRPDRKTDGQPDRKTDGRTDRQTDMTKLVVAFRNFANAPKNESFEAFWSNSHFSVPRTVPICLALHVEIKSTSPQFGTACIACGLVCRPYKLSDYAVLSEIRYHDCE
jgi:hypothetical protein